ncbi:uncharacterized protein RHOBADRAFT_50725, partial [Rhodotorula graminis WP1]
MHDDLQGTVVPSLLVQHPRESFPAPPPPTVVPGFPLASSPSSSSSSSVGLYGPGYVAEPLAYGDPHAAAFHSVHAPWLPPPPPPLAAAPSTSFGAPPPSSSSTGFLARLSPSLSPVDGLSAAWPMPSTAAALTVGDVLGSVPGVPAASSASHRGPFAHLASQAGPDGGFENEHVVEGLIGLAPRVKPFVAKLSHLLSQPHNFQDCVVWDSSGASFILNANERFVGDVLPRLFGHGNVASFTRQLNLPSPLGRRARRARRHRLDRRVQRVVAPRLYSRRQVDPAPHDAEAVACSPAQEGQEAGGRAHDGVVVGASEGALDDGPDYDDKLGLERRELERLAGVRALAAPAGGRPAARAVRSRRHVAHVVRRRLPVVGVVVRLEPVRPVPADRRRAGQQHARPPAGRAD